MSARWQIIRQEAHNVRVAYATRTGAPCPAMLPLELVVDELWQLTAFADPNLDAQIQGELNITQQTIRFQPNLPDEQIRFLIAHEIGHYALEAAPGKIFYEDKNTLDPRSSTITAGTGRVRTYNTRERHELEANLFALELLIPAQDLWQAIQIDGWDVASMATHWGVTIEALHTQLLNITCHEPVYLAHANQTSAQTLEINEDQQAAISAPLPTLVIAGPGTGKTRSIVEKYCGLVEQGVDPASILALTFSNKAAEEMQERISGAMRGKYPHLVGRIEINTFHAWCLNLLKQYGPKIGLSSKIQLRDTGGILVLLQRRINELPLQEYKSLDNPLKYLPDILKAISRAKDELRDPHTYSQLVEVDAKQLVAEADQATLGKSTKGAAEKRNKAQQNANRLRELAKIYTCYEKILREEEVLDFGDLIVRAIEVLRIADVVNEVHQCYQYILVDESQDINYASGVLLQLLDGGRGCVWAVGDPWQSIYGFRGASPATLANFQQTYPNTTVTHLSLNYRSVQPILDASHIVMAQDPDYHNRPRLYSQRKPTLAQTVQEWFFPDAESEAHAIAQAIIYTTGGCNRHLLRRLARRWQRSPYHYGLLSRRRRWRLTHHAVLCRNGAIAERVSSILRAYGLATNWTSDLFEETVIKDILAICSMGSSKGQQMILRVINTPDFALDSSDLAKLVQIAHSAKISLRKTIQQLSIHTQQLSKAGQTIIARLHVVVAALGWKGDAWQTLTQYLLDHSPSMRDRICRAASDDHIAQTELAAIGQLMTIVAQFVRQAPPHEQDIAHFLAHQRLLTKVNEPTPFVQNSSKAVHIMTIHKAKGLEFPIVYVPAIQENVFSSRGKIASIPHAPSVFRSISPDKREEDRYTLYVAMTRAKDRLILSRAALAMRSSLLPDQAIANWNIRQFKSVIPCSMAMDRVAIKHQPIVSFPIPAASLETYERCPRQYLYQYGYQLFDDSTAFQQMHSAIRTTVVALLQAAQENSSIPTWNVVETLIQEALKVRGVLEDPYADAYMTQALGHISHIWEQMQAEPTSTNSTFNQRFLLNTVAGEVEVRVDQVDQDRNGPIWTRILSGKEKDDDHLKLRLVMYALAYEAVYHQKPRIQIYYTATGVMAPVNHQQRTLDDRREKVATYMRGIAAGDWRPNQGHACQSCAFTMICPI
ncbi:UvrD-helicase domain-containing protein [Herpetosiphon sp. NSE202]|uniref:UvrD-helicase domain-containing protein n=1 Tax=Herpetosiphon sp. NSE202 TaxID=3351349 RepID=UPI00363A1489